MKQQTINGFPIRRMPLSKLKPADWNPRKISSAELEKLQRSLEEFGTVEPIVVNETTGNVVGGHQRLRALLAAGHTDTDVIVVKLDESREKQLNIALNKISGDWDDDMLREVFQELLADGADLTLTGFDEDEWNALLPKEDLNLSDFAPDSLDQQDFYMSFTLTKDEYEVCCKAMDTARESGEIKKPKNDKHSAKIFFALCNDYLQKHSC